MICPNNRQQLFLKDSRLLSKSDDKPAVFLIDRLNMINILTLPFHIETYDGFAYTNGFLRIQSDHVLVEFQTKDALFGVVKSAIKNVELPFGEIGDVVYKSNILRTVVIITVHSFQTAAALGNGNEDVKFYIKRKNRKKAESFVDNLKLYVAEHQLKRLEQDGMDDQKLLDD